MNSRRWLGLIASALVGVSPIVAQNNSTAAAAAAAAVASAAAQASVQGTTGVAMPAAPVPPRVVPGLPRVGTAAEARVTNLSTRARVTADNPLISGFAISGDAPRTLLLRAVGPSLGAFGIADRLPAPRLRLFDAKDSLVTENNGWAATPANVPRVADAIIRTGAFPFSANAGTDAAVVVTLAPGSYTVHVTADNGVAGTTLAEIYDVDGTAEGSRLVNVSTRSTVTASDDLISGFVVAGTAARRFLVRGVGPGLAQFGVTSVLASPTIALYDAGGIPLASNGGWSAGFVPVVTTTGTTSVISFVQSATSATAAAPLTAAAAQVGAFVLTVGSADAAMIVTLAPGAYTVQVGNAAGDSGSGAALLEIYELL